MALELGKHLDAQLRAHVPALMKAHGFKAKRSPRSWVRDVGGCHQAVAVVVDGRSARDGYLLVGVEAGVAYEGDDRTPFSVGGEAIRWHAGNLSGHLKEPEWRFDERALNADYGGGIGRYVERSVLPALDRFVDPVELRDHFMLQGHQPWDVIDLSLKAGDGATARTFAAATVRFFVLRRQADPIEAPPRLVAKLLALADELGVAIDDRDRAALLAGRP